MPNDNVPLVLSIVLILPIVLVFLITIPKEITTEELYRFCMVKSIPLEECLVPEKPYKGEEDAK